MKQNERPVKEKVWLMMGIEKDLKTCVLGVYKQKWKAERDQKLAEDTGWPGVLVIEQDVIQ